MKFHNLSLKSKVLISIVPFILMVFVITFVIYKFAFTEETRLKEINNLKSKVKDQSSATYLMAEHFMRYLLDPSQEQEYKMKIEADQEVEKLSEDIKEIAKKNDLYQEIYALSSELTKYDSEVMTKHEDTIKALFLKKDPTSHDYFTNNYVPARKKQLEMFDSMSSKLQVITDKITQTVLTEQRFNLTMVLLILWLGSVFGSSILILTLNSTTKKFFDSFHKLQSILGNLSKTSSTLHKLSQNLFDRVQAESAAIQETAAEMDEVNAMVQATTANTEVSRDKSQESKSAVGTGKGAVEEMNQAIHEIATSNGEIMQQIEDSNSKIEDIVKMISEIGSKTKVINDIVFQTKLLSFNASIEAARAGEHGKGFAVVAEEVGNLAHMSGAASKEISVLLEDSIKKVQTIVNETKVRVAHLVGVGKEKIEKGTETAIRCSDSLQSILTSVEQVDQLVDQIASAANEQTMGISEIGTAINRLNTVTQENNSIATNSSGEATSINEQCNELSVVVMELRSLLMGKESKMHTKNSTSSGGGKFAQKSIAKVLPFTSSGKKEKSYAHQPIKVQDSSAAHNSSPNSTSKHSSNSSSSNASESSMVMKKVSGDLIPNSNDPRFEEI